MNLIHPVALPVPAMQPPLTGREKVRMLSRLARQALHHSAHFSGKVLGELLKSETGAPLPSQGIHWSLTHKNEWVAAVTAPDTIGIDLETIRDVDTRLFERVADTSEWSRIGEPDLAHFFRLWTAKEAVLKAVGLGIAGLGKCKLDTLLNHDTLIISYDGSEWMVTHHWIGREHLIAVTAEPEAIEWHVLSETII